MHRLSFRFLRLLAVAAILSPILSGCGPARTEVSGQVKYNGQPLVKQGCTISFLGIDGIPRSGEVDTSGNYHVPEVCLGENKVSVVYSSAPPSGGRGKRAPDPGRAPEIPKGPTESFALPPSYATPETSGLTVVVEKGTKYDPELKGPPIK